MTINTEDLLNSILESISRIDYIRSKNIPDIDLYMDQVTTFIDAGMQSSKRYPEDKVLTKTMINNYAKNNLLPPPINKKYSKEHMVLLIYIYYFKGILSIKDIETLLHPLIHDFFGKQDDFNILSLYEDVCETQKKGIESLQKSIKEAYDEAESLAENAKDTGHQDYIQQFAFISALSFDVYVKKMLIEKLIDELPKPPSKK